MQLIIHLYNRQLNIKVDFCKRDIYNIHHAEQRRPTRASPVHRGT